jgi:hypothetical protein
MGSGVTREGIGLLLKDGNVQEKDKLVQILFFTPPLLILHQMKVSHRKENSSLLKY